MQCRWGTSCWLWISSSLGIIMQCWHCSSDSWTWGWWEGLPFSIYKTPTAWSPSNNSGKRSAMQSFPSYSQNPLLWSWVSYTFYTKIFSQPILFGLITTRVSIKSVAISENIIFNLFLKEMVGWTAPDSVRSTAHIVLWRMTPKRSSLCDSWQKRNHMEQCHHGEGSVHPDFWQTLTGHGKSEQYVPMLILR